MGMEALSPADPVPLEAEEASTSQPGWTLENRKFMRLAFEQVIPVLVQDGMLAHCMCSYGELTRRVKQNLVIARHLHVIMQAMEAMRRREVPIGCAWVFAIAWPAWRAMPCLHASIKELHQERHFGIAEHSLSHICSARRTSICSARIIGSSAYALHTHQVCHREGWRGGGQRIQSDK